VRALDQVLPAYDHHETHDVEVDASPEVAVASFLALPSSTGALQARRAFGRYWRLVAPFSALIRRRWLRAAAANARSAAVGAASRRL
jgi:hypothetical protein